MSGKICPLGGKRRHEPRVGPGDVGDDGNFSVAVSLATANPDRRDVELVGELAGGVRNDAFEDDAKAARFLKRQSAFEEGFDF